jgi:hypothetical protein
MPPTPEPTATEAVAYRADASFTAAYSAFRAKWMEAHVEVCSYNSENAAHPLAVTKSNIDHSYSVIGFQDVHPNRPEPAGLSRARTRQYLVPARGKPGEPWRRIIRKHNRYPALAQDVFAPHGVPVYRTNGTRVLTAGVHDFSEHGLFVVIGGGYPEPGEHLMQVPLSEFHVAKEKHDAAKAVPGV